jgi:PAS domain S-box-containing protein
MSLIPQSPRRLDLDAGVFRPKMFFPLRAIRYPIHAKQRSAPAARTSPRALLLADRDSFMKNQLDAPHWPALKIAGCYLIVGALWILFSDEALLYVIQDPVNPVDPVWLSHLQTYKGWFYVFVTAALVFVLVQRYVERIHATHQSLSESRRRLEILLSNLPGMAYRCANDEAWTMEFVSLGCRDLTGYEPDDLVANRTRAFADLIHPDDRASVWNHVQDALRQNAPYRMTYRLRAANGREKWVWEQGRAILAAGGNLVALEGFIADITELKETQEVLSQRVREITAVHDVCRHVNESLSLAQTATAGLDGLFAAANPDLGLLFLRRGSELILQSTRAHRAEHTVVNAPIHAVGECLCGLAARDAQPQYSLNIFDDPRCTWEECKKSGLRSFAALPLRVGDETMGVLGLASLQQRDFRSQATFLETLAGEIALGMHNAILFDRIREHERELEREVARRTADLQQTNQELEAFTYSVSHDLRAPLRHIDGFAQMLVDRHGASIPPDGRHQLEVIRKSAQKMGGLIDDLLALSRIGRKALEKNLVDCGMLVREVWAELNAQDAEKSKKFVLEPLPNALADPKLLRQVWANLLGNALKYSSTRPNPEIMVDSHLSEGNTWYRIRDNGVGFDPRYADKLFVVFQRLHREEEFPGTGVGLAIVARIVHKHGGQVRGFGQIEQGATFEFTLGESNDGFV